MARSRQVSNSFSFGCALRMQPKSTMGGVLLPSLLLSWPLSAGGLPCCVEKLLFIPRIYFLSLLVLRPFRSSDKSNFHPGLATSTSPPRSTRRRSSCTRRRSGWIARTMSTTPIEGESVVGLIRLSTVKRNTSCTAIMNLPDVQMARVSDQ